MATNRTKAETEGLAEKVAIILRWYVESKNSNSARLEKTYKDLVHKILGDETVMSEDEIDVYLTTLSLKARKLGVECVTDIEVKEKLEKY
jgi:hypothetical protein